MLRRVQALKEPNPQQAKPLSLTERRVRMIIDFMADGLFIPGQTDRLLAESWGLSVDRVRKLTSEASRRFKEIWPEAEKAELRARGLQSISRIAGRLEGIGTANALAYARQCWIDLMHYSGLDPAAKLEHTGRDGTALGVTPTAAAALVREQFGDQARRAAEDAKEKDKADEGD